ncbi:MAG: hypothetical protein IJH04_07255 [Eggerthellaceae bacterium]|nr:hypothetical protein [Eggerthellaceae bacterium]MBQ6404288.1 hypothetical protein [Oscillospiraceae bacterium]
MSVPSGERNESTVEFIYNARRLQIYTMRMTKSWPTRWRYDVSSPLVQDARYIFQEIKAGNKIWPANEHEAQLRRDHFMNAQGRLDSMISQIEIACEFIDAERRQNKNSEKPARDMKKAMAEWSAIAAKEISLLTELMKSDRKRFRFDRPQAILVLAELITSYLVRFGWIQAQEDNPR